MEWIANPQQIADGFNVDVEEFFDSVSGTTVSALSESQVAKLLGGKRVKGSQLPYDVIVEGRKSPNSLYSEDLSTFENDSGAYDQRDAEGFIKINSLRLKTRKK